MGGAGVDLPAVGFDGELVLVSLLWSGDAACRRPHVIGCAETSAAISFGEIIIAGAARLVPKLRGLEFTDTRMKVWENHLEEIRATANWIETAAATGQVDLDELLAQLLRGQ
ncbi:DUF6192 family protein [Streptomyces sp. NPDC001056]